MARSHRNSVAMSTGNSTPSNGGTPPRRRSLTKAQRKAEPAKGGVMKPRHHSGTISLREIRQYQRSTEFLIPKESFKRLAASTVAGAPKGQPMRLGKEALESLQEAAENRLVKTFEAAQLLAIHGKRLEIKKENLQLVDKLVEIFNQM